MRLREGITKAIIRVLGTTSQCKNFKWSIERIKQSRNCIKNYRGEVFCRNEFKKLIIFLCLMGYIYNSAGGGWGVGEWAHSKHGKSLKINILIFNRTLY